MNERGLVTLEFDKVKNQLTGMLISPGGRQELAALQPATDAETIQCQIDETKDGADVLRLKGGIPLPELADVTPHMKRLAIDASLNGTELAAVGRVLQTATATRTFFKQLVEDGVELRHLDDVADQIITLPDLTKKISTAIEPDGRVADAASEDLAEIRRRIKGTEDLIRSRMQNYLKGNQARYLSEPIITMRNDRYVVPVKTEYRSRFGGVVHDESQSGQTLYVEPKDVVDLNNRLRQSQVQERNEEARILQELSALLAPHREEILANAGVLGHLDFVNAKARYAKLINATEPLLSEAGLINLRQARHPLLDPKTAVANDITLGDAYDAIIITGPNTGGKTITLKTLGLTQLMAQSGLFIPAFEGSSVAIFDNIFADIGDEQSIEQSLSTFSSHMDNLISILDQATDKSLVLVDELGAGTDPKEGAALAIAILDAFGTLGADVVATTHYPELKAYGYDRARTTNASMEFDGETLQPTYRLLLGIPGRSNALEISQRLGLRADIIAAARELTSQDSQDLNAMIGDLVTRHKQATDEAAALAEQLADAERLHDDLNNQFERYQEQKAHQLDVAKQEANHIVAEAKKESDKIIHHLRQLEVKQGSGVRENELIDAQGRLNALRQNPSLAKNKVLARERKKHDFHPGDAVVVKSYGQHGTLNRQTGTHEWEVQMGALKMRVDDADLEKSTAPTETEKQQRASKAVVHSNIGARAQAQLDLRGHRYDVAMGEVDRFIDSALLANLNEVTIVHGKGTGALRQGVTEYLQSNPRVKSFGFSPANAGGDGATVVKLG
ncbi:endonuclease MutS2 [Furfurilactobacillus siliginis]|uniref:Endonuclease MutS2 n=1 Tax=Furfurilactobacillus siliginis TaxID=348151 RepID=A0A0R2L157_9LACO|nr:endonuclease MutS2 [Furfurilactobacillus siliginis]KRN95442.1 recombination and DNA strand exchange inhibitor protein [Furfurilactobacillus siliginis]GEK28214.1 endonuclease MutS2 [Furfurilactobacillus siliginis]